MSAQACEKLAALLRRVERALELASALACPAEAEVERFPNLFETACAAKPAFDQLKAEVVDAAGELERQ